MGVGRVQRCGSLEPFSLHYLSKRRHQRGSMYSLDYLQHFNAVPNCEFEPRNASKLFFDVFCVMYHFWSIGQYFPPRAGASDRFSSITQNTPGMVKRTFVVPPVLGVSPRCRLLVVS